MAVVYSTSSGISIGCPDIDRDPYGCDPKHWERNSRVCKNYTTMEWVERPVVSEHYRIFAGDEDSSVSQYTPDGYLDISVRVVTYGMNYRGIVVYAVDAGGNRVGAWDVPPSGSFRVVTDCPEETTVTHNGADHKPSHAILKWRAPNAGTGTVTFRAMVKYGNANVGEFYFPENTLVLTEGTTSATSEWFVTEVGQSCEEYCDEQDLFCDYQALTEINSASVFSQASFLKFACEKPLISSCTIGPTTGSRQWCYFREAAEICNATIHEAPDPCTVKSTDLESGQRFCKCSETETYTDEDVSPSALLSVNLVLLSALVGMLSNRNSSKTVLIICIVAFISFNGVSAHNWVNTDSRSPIANTYNPCPPRNRAVPHIQVGVGDTYQIEWMIGHPGRRTYFVLVKAEDEDKLYLHDDRLLNAYINAAPENLINDVRYQKIHRKSTESLLMVDDESPKYFDSLISDGHPSFFPRPVEFTNRLQGPGNAFSYKPEDHANDAYVSYNNPEYPWILSVARYEHADHMPSEFDAAQFFMPDDAPFGRYIAHYVWGGYRDCIDIDYTSEEVEFIYGNKTGADVWQKIDHCFFRQPQRIRSKITEMPNDSPDWCMKECIRRFASADNCGGVQVLPLHTPDTVYEGYRNINLIDWMNSDLNVTFDAFKDKDPSEKRFVCYPLQPFVPTDTEGEFVISLDPEDPVFYGTCYRRSPNIQFIGYNTQSYEKELTPWKFHKSCLSCDSKSKNDDQSQFGILDLDTISMDTCVDCDLEPSLTYSAKPEPQILRRGAICDGADTNVNNYVSGAWSRASHSECNNTVVACIKTLIPLGRGATGNDIVMNIEECAALAERDPECSNTVMLRNDGYLYRRGCMCYTKHECCHTCSPKPDVAYDIWEVSPQSPDPTCENGQLSTDGTACCSKSCGYEGACSATSTTVDYFGMCCKTPGTCIPEDRTCDKFGPPCLNPESPQ